MRKCYYKSYTCDMHIQFILFLAMHTCNTKIIMGVFGIDYKNCEDAFLIFRAKTMISNEIVATLPLFKCMPPTKNLE